MKRSRLLLGTGYVLAALLLVLPLLEPLVTLLPPRPGAVRWRLQAFGAFSQALVLPLLGATLAVGTAVLLDQRKVVRVLAGVAFGFGLLLAMATLLFALDLVEYRGAIGVELREYYQVAGLIYFFALSLGAAFLFWLGWAAGRAAGWPRHGVRHHTREPEPPLAKPGAGERV
jgi:hypothetical protein